VYAYLTGTATTSTMRYTRTGIAHGQWMVESACKWLIQQVSRRGDALSEDGSTSVTPETAWVNGTSTLFQVQRQPPPTRNYARCKFQRLLLRLLRNDIMVRIILQVFCRILFR